MNDRILFAEPLPREFHRAACRFAPDPDVFAPWGGKGAPPHKELRKATQWCDTCEITESCEAYALRNKLSGVWGGQYIPMRPNDRRKKKRDTA